MAAGQGVATTTRYAACRTVRRAPCTEPRVIGRPTGEPGHGQRDTREQRRGPAGRPGSLAVASTLRDPEFRCGLWPVGSRCPRLQRRPLSAATPFDGGDRADGALAPGAGRRNDHHPGDPGRLSARGCGERTPGASDHLFASPRIDALPVDRLPADRAQDRDRAAVHHLVRLRLHARSCCSCSCCRSFRSWSQHRRLQDRSIPTSWTSRARPGRATG